MIALQRIANRGVPAMTRAVFRDIQSRFGTRYVVRNIHDYRMVLDLKDPGISRALNLFGERELDMKFMLERFIKPGMTIFDIGSNIGYYPLLELSLLRGVGKVVCIEPAPENVKLLKRNLELNEYFGRLYGNMPVVQAAVSDKTSKRTFHLSEFSNLGTFHPVETSFTNGQSITVETVTISNLADRYGNPDLIRMDIEGHEVEVVRSVPKDTNRPIIVFEVHTDRYSTKHDFATVLGRLFTFGYSVEILSSNNPVSTKRIMALDYVPTRIIKTDATYRALFEDVRNDHAIDLICRKGGVRAVVLKLRS